MIVEEILKSAEQCLKERTVQEIVVGLGYTAVLLDDESCGLAITLRDETTGCCSLMERAGSLTGCPASSLGKLILSANALDSSVGLATINACLNKDIKSNTDSPIEALKISKDDVVGMVGYFEPLVPMIQQRCKQLHVFERKPSNLDFVHPDWAANMLIPQCDIVIISGATFINKTLDPLLGLCRGKVGILGPSTPLSPLLKKCGVSFLFGSVVKDWRQVLKVVAQAGGTRNFGEFVEKVNLRLD